MADVKRLGVSNHVIILSMKLQNILIIIVSAFIGFFTAKYFNEEDTQHNNTSCIIKGYNWDDLNISCVEIRYGLPPY